MNKRQALTECWGFYHLLHSPLYSNTLTWAESQITAWHERKAA
ncbi:hypothetical protein [Acinetobacter sp. CIP-A165]|nr:hypothetical protein [Acinetobacter sp. CIP-A165]